MLGDSQSSVAKYIELAMILSQSAVQFSQLVNEVRGRDGLTIDRREFGEKENT